MNGVWIAEPSEVPFPPTLGSYILVMLPNWIKDRIAATFPQQWVQWVIWRSPKEAEMSYLESLVPRGMASVDVGANIGIYTAALAKLTPMVHAFEPSPRLATSLRRSAPPNVCVHQQAVSDKPGTATPLSARQEFPQGDSARALAFWTMAVALVLKDDLGRRRRQGEDDVEIGNRQQLGWVAPSDEDAAVRGAPSSMR